MSKYATNKGAVGDQCTVKIDMEPDAAHLDAIRRPSDEYVRSFLGKSQVEWVVVSSVTANGTTIGSASAFFLSGWLNIQTVWVEPEYRNCGLGSKILHDLEEVAKRRSTIGLRLVTTSFSNAHGVYAKLGFQVDATWPIYSETGELHDEIQMTKYLRTDQVRCRETR